MLYIPDDRIAPDQKRDQRLLKMVNELRASAGTGALEITRDKRGFRRAFLNAFILPAANLANQFALYDGPNAEWIAQHEKELGEAFFAAQWLMSKDLIPTFQVPRESAQPQTTILPHEQAPPAANHVVKRHEMERAAARRAGEILGSLMLLWATRTFEARSFEPWREAIPRVVKPPALSDLILGSAAEQIGHWAQQFQLGKPGAILGQYVFEALLALLCDANDVANPRKEQWTFILLLYEYHRRVDGNDELLLLPAELVQRTIDLTEFWSGVRAIQRSIGPLDLQAEPQHNDVVQRHEHIVETVRRLFPDYARDVETLEIRIPETVPDARVAAILSEQLGVAVAALPDRTALQMLLSALTRGRKHLLEGAIDELRSALDAAGASTEQRMVALRAAIEILNLAHLHVASAKLADEAQQLIETAQSADPKFRAILYNEIGNCHRYAGRFAAALQAYDAALALWGNDLAKRDTRVVLRNRAIVLRGLHRYAEAQQGFAELRPFAQDVDLLGLLNSETICLMEMGEQDQAAKLLDDHAELIEGAPVDHAEARSLGLLRAKLLLRRGQVDDARAIALHIAAVAKAAQDPITQASAADILVDAINDELPEPEQAKQRQDAILVLQSALSAARELAGMPELLSGIAATLDDVLVADGRVADGEALIRGILAEAVPGRPSKAWALAMHAYAHAVRRRDFHQATQDMMLGVDLLASDLWSVSAQGDPVAFLAPNADGVTHLTKRMLEGVTARNPVGAASLRIAADLRAAPLLTPRLRRRAGLPSPVTDKPGEAERLHQLMRETPCIIMQFVSLSNDVGLLMTRPEPDRSQPARTPPSRAAPGRRRPHRAPDRLRNGAGRSGGGRTGSRRRGRMAAATQPAARARGRLPRRIAALSRLGTAQLDHAFLGARRRACLVLRAEPRRVARTPGTAAQRARRPRLAPAKPVRLRGLVRVREPAGSRGIAERARPAGRTCAGARCAMHRRGRPRGKRQKAARWARRGRPRLHRVSWAHPAGGRGG